MMIGSNLTAGHHDNYFDFDESTLSTGTELLLRIVVNLLGKQSFSRP